MFGLSEKIRWLLFFIGAFLVVLGILDHRELLNNYSILEFIAFPYIWALGLILIFIGYGFDKQGDKPGGSGGVDGAPYETKKGPFGDGYFGGDGGDSGGGD